MFEPLRILQTISKKHSPEITENNGPVFCHDIDNVDWLGEGYYFWEHYIDLAHEWGRIHYNYHGKDYFICESLCQIDEHCFDLYNSHVKRDEFESYVRKVARNLKKHIRSILVRDVIVFLRSKPEFIEKYDSIRILGDKSFKRLLKGKHIMAFSIKQDAYFVRTPAIQICLFDSNSQNRKGYKIIDQSDQFSWA